MEDWANAKAEWLSTFLELPNGIPSHDTFNTLSRYEQEVAINLNTDEEEATVYTANPVWMRKMDKLCKEFSEVIWLKLWTEVSKTYVLPKKLIKNC